MKQESILKKNFLNSGYAKILFILALSVLMILIPGILRIINGADIYVGFYEKRVIMVGLTLFAAYIIATIDFRFWTRYSMLFYGIGVVQVILLSLYGKSIEGNVVRWIEWKDLSFDCSVMTIMAIIMILPYCINIISKKGGSKKLTVTWMSLAGLMLAVPLLMLCRDVGSFFVIVAITIIVTISYVTDYNDKICWGIIVSLLIISTINVIICHVLGLLLLAACSRIMMLAAILITYMLIYLKKIMDEVTVKYGKYLVLAVMTRIAASYLLILLSVISNLTDLGGGVFVHFSDSYLIISMYELGCVFSATNTTKKLKEKAVLKEFEGGNRDVN